MEKYCGEYGLGSELGSIIVDRYLGDTNEHGCYSGHGEAIFRSGNTYVGEFRNGVMDGRGRYTWITDGTVYEGDFSKNELVGNGRYTWGNGSRYEGALRSGLRNGEGTFTSADGTLVYEGLWKEGKRHGYGVQRYGVGTSSAFSYAGEWHENARHGRGTMTYASGNKYKGDWVEDRKEGEGVMTWVQRRERYTGEWKTDQQCGYGVHVWEEDRPEYSVTMDTQKQMCNVYRGQWLAGMRHGQGTFLYADGSKYVGYWLGNKKHGPSVFVSDNGRTFECRFEDDFMVSKIRQNFEHPEVSSAIKFNIADITRCGRKADTLAIVREVERSALQINSDLKLVYKRYAKAGATGPRNSTMFTMSLQQFVTFARDCRALRPFTPITAGEVYRMFFRMRRQHAWELTSSLRRAMEQASIKGHDILAARVGSQGRNGIPAWLSDMDVEEEIYDSRKAITFREFVEGVVRLAATVGTVSIDGGARPFSKASRELLSAATTSSAAPNLPTSGVSNAAPSTTIPWSPALSCLGAAPPMEGNESMTGSSRADEGYLLGEMGRNAAGELSVNDHFKRFVTDHLHGLMHVLSENAGSFFSSSGGGQGDDNDEGRGVRREADNVNRGSGPAGRGKCEEAEVETEDMASQAEEKLEEAEAQVKLLYRIYSGPMDISMTLRGLLRIARDADLKRRTGLTSADIKQVFAQASQSMDKLRKSEAPSHDISNLDRLGEPAEPSAMTAAVDLDTMDHEIIPDDFKIVLVKLFGMLRVKVTEPADEVATAEAGGLAQAGAEGTVGVLESDGQYNRCRSPASKEDEEPLCEILHNSNGLADSNGSRKTADAVSPPEGHALRGDRYPNPSPWLPCNPREFVSQVLVWTEEGRAKRAGRVALRLTVPRRSLTQSKHLSTHSGTQQQQLNAEWYVDR